VNGTAEDYKKAELTADALLSKYNSTNTKIIAVTGGKGGTGKTLVALGLSVFLSTMNKRVLLLDCDVDAPNVAVLLNVELKNKQNVVGFLPEFDPVKCTYCGKCSEVCPEKAILAAKNKLPYVFENLCSGCEACKIVCPYDAITDRRKILGWTFEGKAADIDIISGELKISEINATEIVKAVRERAAEKSSTIQYDYIIIDTSPGAHCNVIRSILGADIAVAVTEPTPFGFHDLELILRLLNKINVNSTIVVNRCDLTDSFKKVNELAEKYNSSILGKIPVDPKIMDKYVNQSLLDIDKDASIGFNELYNMSKSLVEKLEKNN